MQVPPSDTNIGMLNYSPKYLAELRGPQPENAYGESERLGLAKLGKIICWMSNTNYGKLMNIWFWNSNILESSHREFRNNILFIFKWIADVLLMVSRDDM